MLEGSKISLMNQETIDSLKNKNTEICKGFYISKN